MGVSENGAPADSTKLAWDSLPTPHEASGLLSWVTCLMLAICFRGGAAVALSYQRTCVPNPNNIIIDNIHAIMCHVLHTVFCAEYMRAKLDTEHASSIHSDEYPDGDWQCPQRMRYF